MYKVGDIFYLDNEYSARAEFCNQNNLIIVEIAGDSNGRKFQIQEIPAPSAKELAEQEIIELKTWFSDYYTYKEQKYRRLIALNMQTDEGTDPNQELISLYNEAENKRRRIQTLENQ